MEPVPAQLDELCDSGCARQCCGKVAARSGPGRVLGTAVSLAISREGKLGAGSREHVKGDPAASPCKMLLHVLLQLRHLLFCHDGPSQ